MTDVCLVGKEELALRAELLAYENARSALSAYDLREPYENTVAVETVSLGMAVSLLGDLDWYLRRLADDALVREPSIDPEEWLSRSLATAVRDGDVAPEETGTHLKVYGLDRTRPADGPEEGDQNEADATDDESGPDLPRRPRGRLVEPMYVTRTDGDVPEYDLRDVEETVVVRVTPDEFS
ncbi:MAG: DUF5804 family protein [Halobacteriaceae archaeon]